MTIPFSNPQYYKNIKMKKLTILTFLTFIALVGFAQVGRFPKRTTLKATVVDSIDRVQYGYLAAVADSGIIMLKSPVVFDQTLANSNLNTIAYQNIKELTLKRKGRVGRGILIGSVSGFLAGAVIGVVTYKPCNGEYCLDPGQGGQAIGLGFLGAIGGGIVGGIVGGGIKKTWPIGGQKNRFDDMKSNVLDMTYGKK
jgi:hypothetical protein